MMNKKPIVIYHSPCIDGFACAFQFWEKYGNDYEYYPGVYGEQYPDVLDRDVIICDFSYKYDVMVEILDQAKSVVILDHHLTAINDLKDLIHPKLTKVFNIKKSGATIVHKYLNPKESTPMFYKYIEDRDLWLFKLANSNLINLAIASHEYNFNTWQGLRHSTRQLRDDGYILARKQRKDLNELLKGCKRRMDINGINVPVANIPYIFASEAGEVLAKGEPFSATYFDTATLRKFSLRSEVGGHNVAEIAEAYGGGGHFHSSGFSVDRQHPLAML